MEEQRAFGDLQSVASDPPTLSSAQPMESGPMRGIRVDGGGDRAAGFSAFLDGAQKVQVLAQDVGVPIVLGTVSAVVRARTNRRLATWGHMPPRVERRIYLPKRYLPALGDTLGDVLGDFEIVDTAEPDARGNIPSQHPASLMERAIQLVQRDRERLEIALAEAWCAREEGTLFIDGGISASPRVASSGCAIGVVKSHRTIYAEDADLRTVLALGAGERSSVFRLSPRSRSSVMSWYLRMRSNAGRDAMWGLVRVEAAESANVTDRANEISRWILAEGAPLALPDGRWDKMAYGIRDCEEFLRAIS